MRVVDGVKEFNVDTDEKLSSFMGYLNDIYAGNHTHILLNYQESQWECSEI